MYIFQSSIKLVYAGVLSALLTSALRRTTPEPEPENTTDSMQLMLYGTNNFDAIKVYGEGGFTTYYDQVTLTGGGSVWRVVGQWDGTNAQAKKFGENYARWEGEVIDAARRGDNTVLAAGRDDEGSGLWIIIREE